MQCPICQSEKVDPPPEVQDHTLIGKMMKSPKEIASKLRKFLNDNDYTLSDIRKAQILILNGKLGKDSLPKRSPVLAHVVFDYAPPADDLRAMKKYLKMEEPC